MNFFLTVAVLHVVNAASIYDNSFPSEYQFREFVGGAKYLEAEQPLTTSQGDNILDTKHGGTITFKNCASNKQAFIRGELNGFTEFPLEVICSTLCIHLKVLPYGCQYIILCNPAKQGKSSQYVVSQEQLNNNCFMSCSNYTIIIVFINRWIMLCCHFS